MNKIQVMINSIEPLDDASMELARRRLDNLTKPVGSLAALEELAVQYAGAVRNPRPPLPQKAIVLMAADHGVAAEGVSAYPQSVTEQMVYNFVHAGAAINVFAAHAGAKLILVDVGVNAEFPQNLPIEHQKVRYGTSNMRLGAAMSRVEAIQAICSGIDVVNKVLAPDVRVIGLGEMGIGNTTASSAVASVLLGIEPEAVVGQGTGIIPAQLGHKVGVVRDAIAVNAPNHEDIIDVLAKVGGLEIAALCGVVLAAAARRILVVLDGFISTSAVLAAYRLAPQIRPYLIASHLSAEPGHEAILTELNLIPKVLLNMRLGEGTGAALGMTLLDAGVKILNEMTTFAEARVAYALQDLLESESRQVARCGENNGD